MYTPNIFCINSNTNSKYGNILGLFEEFYGCVMYMIYNQNVTKYLYLAHSCKLGMKDAKFGVID
jgi:hypothetical protein